MNIMQIAPYFLPFVGGQEMYIFHLSRYLVEMGHSVDIVTSNFPKSHKYENMNGINIFRYQILMRPLRNPIIPELLTIGDTIKKYDLIHTHNEYGFSSIVAMMMKKKYSIPLVLTCHGQLVFGEYFKDHIVSFYNKSLGRLILEGSDVIVVNSPEDKEFMLKMNKKLNGKIAVLHNAIDPESLKGFNISSTFNFQHNFCILYVGRLIRRKGLEWLIHAMKILHDTGKLGKIKCLLVGEGEDKNYFNNLMRRYKLEDSILFLGNVSKNELMSLYQNSNCFILPSLSETCPTVILEAMYFGLPVIATDIPGVRDHFKDHAFLVPPKDEKLLADAIIKMKNDDEMAKRLSIKGKSLVHTKYIWEHVAKEYENIYKKVTMK